MKNTTTKNVESARDAFGSRQGTMSAKMNAVVIASKDGTVNAETLAKKAGVSTRRAYNHLLWLAKHDYIKFN